ncbi:hypothetical protein ACFLVS_07065, partial [Chloroflexota bacterium]
PSLLLICCLIYPPFPFLQRGRLLKSRGSLSKPNDVCILSEGVSMKMLRKIKLMWLAIRLRFKAKRKLGI